MSMGMVFVSPQTLSLPIKLLLFVLADGWNLVVGSLLRSFR
jgi:flagellar biosynthetic protein FliP